MIDQLSPASRKLIAIALLFLAVVTAINLVIVPVFEAATGTLLALKDARYRLNRLESLAARPDTPAGTHVPTSLYFVALSREAANQMLLARIHSLAVSDGVSVDRANPLPPDPLRPQMLRLDFVASGPEVALVGFAGELEHGTPVIRFAPWELTAPDSAGGPTRFDGHMSAVWSTR